jgi:hypothetical protein
MRKTRNLSEEMHENREENRDQPVVLTELLLCLDTV